MNITVRSVGQVSRITTDSINAHPRDGAFADTTEMVKAMRDPRYGKSPAYTADVHARVAAMAGVAVDNASANDGQHKTLTAQQQEDRVVLKQQELGLSDHDSAMVEKFNAVTANAAKGE